nr:MAG TPA: hypothetical protein [Caudoviricetes sp.]
MAFYALNQILDIGTLHRLSYISIFIIQKRCRICILIQENVN